VSAPFLNTDVMSDGKGGNMLLFVGGRYTGSARRTEAGWKFTSFADEVVFSHRGDLIQFEIPDDRA
jgi:hypothetical protein